MFNLEEKYDEIIEKQRDEMMSKLISQMAATMLEEQECLNGEEAYALEKESAEKVDECNVELLIVSGRLLDKYPDNEDYRETLLKETEDLWLDMKVEMRFFYECDIEVGQELKMFLGILLGENCQQHIVNNISSWYLEESGEAVKEDYVFYKILDIAKKIKETDTEEAKKIVNDLMNCDTEKYCRENPILVKENIYQYVCEYYVNTEELEKAYDLFMDNRESMYSHDFQETMSSGNLIALEFEKAGNIDIAIELMDYTYNYMMSNDVSVSEEYRLIAHYNHYIYRFLHKSETQFLDKLVELFYEMNKLDDASNELINVEIKLAYFILQHITLNMLDVGDYLDLGKKFYELTDSYEEYIQDDSVINKRVAAHLLSYIYTRMGQSYLAESYIAEAIDLHDKYPNDKLDYYNKSNLCMNYFLQNDYEKAKELAEELYLEAINNNYPEDIEPENIARVMVNYSNIIGIEGDRKKATEIIRTALDKKIITAEKIGRVISPLYNVMISNVIGINNSLPEEYEQEFCNSINYVENSDFFEHMTFQEKMEHYATKSLLYWKLGDLSVLEQSKKKLINAYQTLESWELEYISFSSFIIMAIYMEENQIDEAKEIARFVVDANEKSFGKALVYQNREKLNLNSINNQTIVLMSYSVLQYESDPRELYNLVLNYKNIVSLITVFRNSITNKMPELKELIEDINNLLDKKSELKKNEMVLGDCAGIDELDEELKGKEYEFAKRMNPDLMFQPFTIEEMEECIPDNSAFIEYFIFNNDLYLQYLYEEGYSMLDNEILDIFCFVKRNGQCNMERVSVPLDDEFYDEWDFYVEQMEKEHHKKLKVSREILYSYLLKPVERHVKDIENVYIAPESALCNLPFDVFTDNDGVMFGEKHNITIVDSGRDFIKKADNNFYNHFTVVGNPSYNYVKTRKFGGFERGTLFSKKINELPYSEIEAKIVADKLGVIPYIRNDATKNVMKEAAKSRWVHLATHGTYDVDDGEDNWYSSALLFAGVDNWRESGVLGDDYGNGLVTADEISRMDMSHTELVVLSACFTGRVGYVDMAGIRSAFKAAGVKYIISTLWSVGDIPSVIIMDKLYEYLQSYPVPEALRLARDYLKNITLREVEIFFERNIKKYRVKKYAGIQEGIEWFNEKRKLCNSNDKIFSDPYYWSSYICIQNAF